MDSAASPILFPPLLMATDGSPSARLAQKWLYLIAQTLQPSGVELNGQPLVTALTIQPRHSSRSNRLLRRIRRVPAGSPDHTSDRPVATDTVAESLLSEEHLAELLHADFPADFPLSMQVRSGRPATEILNCARTLGAGLIAVGSRGTGGMRELLLGSISAVVARYASCSVLVARGPSDTAVSLNHVLVVVGASIATQAAIAATRQLIPAGIQQVTILYIQPFLNTGYLFGPFAAPTPSWQLNQSLQKVQKEQGEHILNLAKAALEAPSLQIQTLLQTSEPGPLICQVAQQQGVDLVILGSDRKRRSLLPPLPARHKPKNRDASQEELRPVLRNARLNPTEDFVIHHAPCPVLLCRPAQPMTGSSGTE
jgi:nucleotide-binding universal stress UspA family protein